MPVLALPQLFQSTLYSAISQLLLAVISYSHASPLRAFPDLFFSAAINCLSLPFLFKALPNSALPFPLNAFLGRLCNSAAFHVPATPCCCVSVPSLSALCNSSAFPLIALPFRCVACLFFAILLHCMRIEYLCLSSALLFPAAPCHICSFHRFSAAPLIVAAPFQRISVHNTAFPLSKPIDAFPLLCSTAPRLSFSLLRIARPCPASPFLCVSTLFRSLSLRFHSGLCDSSALIGIAQLPRVLSCLAFSLHLFYRHFLCHAVPNYALHSQCIPRHFLSAPLRSHSALFLFCTKHGDAVALTGFYFISADSFIPLPLCNHLHYLQSHFPCHQVLARHISLCLSFSTGRTLSKCRS